MAAPAKDDKQCMLLLLAHSRALNMSGAQRPWRQMSCKHTSLKTSNDRLSGNGHNCSLRRFLVLHSCIACSGCMTCTMQASYSQAYISYSSPTAKCPSSGLSSAGTATSSLIPAMAAESPSLAVAELSALLTALGVTDTCRACSRALPSGRVCFTRKFA